MMISPFEPGNLILIFLQCVILGIPFSIMNLRIFLLIRKIPSLLAQSLIPIVADFIVVDRDVLSVPSDELKDVEVLQTFVDGQSVYDGASSGHVQ